MSLQPKLSFLPITAHDAALQRQRTAEQASAVPRHAAPLKRSAGRPKRPLSAHDVLAAAARAAASKEDEEDAGDEHPGKRARGSYTKWFSSPYIRDILDAYKAAGFRPKVTVQNLRLSACDDRFARLTHSTLARWHDADNKLLPRFAEELKSGTAAARSNGPTRVFLEEPAIEAEIKRVLLSMRAAGTPLNTHVIRWVMQSIIQLRNPALFTYLTLSKSFISNWARQQLHWSWRARTTAASKLPADWEEQGIQMAMRIGANMEMHKVSSPHWQCLGSSCMRELSVRFSCPATGFPAREFPEAQPYGSQLLTRFSLSVSLCRCIPLS
jgi:hypothetical protein